MSDIFMNTNGFSTRTVAAIAKEVIYKVMIFFLVVQHICVAEQKFFYLNLLFSVKKIIYFYRRLLKGLEIIM